MSLRSELRERLLALLFRRREEREMEEELAFHVDMETQENLRSGLSPLEARRRARLALGGEEQVKEQIRDARGSRLIEDLWRDAGLALRMLVRRKEHTAVVLLVLALGIGANTATFTVVDALLLRTLPVTEPERLVMIGNPMLTSALSLGTPRTDIVSYPLFRDVQAGADVLSGLYASGLPGRLDVFVDGRAPELELEPAHPLGRFVSGEFFSVLGVAAATGRVFGPEQDHLGVPVPVVVVSWDYAESVLGGVGFAVGRTLSVNGVPLTVIGVTPAGFAGDVVGSPVKLWLPITLQPTLMPHLPVLDDRGASWLLLMGRLRGGATVDQARSAVSAAAHGAMLANATAANHERIESIIRDEPVRVTSGARGYSYFRGRLGRPMLTLMAAVALVLLVACANVASLTMVRATARTREMGVRMALGAGRLRIARQLLAESLVLAVAGGALGLIAAHWGSGLLLRLATGMGSPLALDAGVDARSLALTAALTLGTALAFGILPAIRASGAGVAGDLHTRSAGLFASGTGPGRPPAGKLLVVTQVAFSLVLLVGTGMLTRSVQRLESADLGFDRDRTLVVRVEAQRAGYEGRRLTTLRQELIDRVASVPGIISATTSGNGLFSGAASGDWISVPGFEANSESDTLVAYDDVGPRYVETIGARLLQGRDIEVSDDEDGAPVTVVNETLARFYFGEGPALGRRIVMGSTTYEVVGVIADAEQSNVRDEPVRRLYVPAAQIDGGTSLHLIARSGGDPASLTQAVKQAILDVDADLTLSSVEPVARNVSISFQQDRMAMYVVTFFGGLAVLLAAVGLYGLMAHMAAQRTSEFGLRMALGAERRTVTLMMLRGALALLAIGVGVGLPLALLSARLLQGQIFGIRLVDWPSVVAALAALGLSTLAAGMIPAIRAARVSPLRALARD